MKKTFLYIFYILITLDCTERRAEKVPPAVPDLNPSRTGNWSAYLGSMNWPDAKTKCAGIGMRLPSPAELQSAVSSGNAKDWIKDGFLFWTDEELFEDNAAVVDIHFGRIFSNRKRNRFVDVRCRL